MKHHVVQVLCLCLLGLASLSFAQFLDGPDMLAAKLKPFVPKFMTVDLRSGSSSPLPAGVTWHSRLTSGSGRCRCDRQGVLKLAFTSTTRVRAQINMTFEESVGFTFNIGDSATNNGYAGDAGTQSNDAEVHSKDDTILFYGHDLPGGGGSYGEQYRRSGFVAPMPYNTMTMDVSDGLATADNGLQYLHVQSPHLFSLNGQSDAEGPVNRDVYLGMNRVVDTPGRSGRGLCKVTVEFFPA